MKLGMVAFNPSIGEVGQEGRVSVSSRMAQSTE